jgi:hypothetical protein
MVHAEGVADRKIGLTCGSEGIEPKSIENPLKNEFFDADDIKTG